MNKKVNSITIINKIEKEKCLVLQFNMISKNTFSLLIILNKIIRITKKIKFNIKERYLNQFTSLNKTHKHFNL